MLLPLVLRLILSTPPPMIAEKTIHDDLSMISSPASVNLSYTNDLESVEEEINSCLVEDRVNRIVADAF